MGTSINSKLAVAAPLVLANMGIPTMGLMIGSNIAKHAKVDLIWVAGCSPALVPQNFEMTTLHYLAIMPIK